MQVNQVSQDSNRNNRALDLCQYQNEDGTWRDFIDERHYKNTYESGQWNIRYLSVDKQIQAGHFGVETKEAYTIIYAFSGYPKSWSHVAYKPIEFATVSDWLVAYKAITGRNVIAVFKGNNLDKVYPL